MGILDQFGIKYMVKTESTVSKPSDVAHDAIAHDAAPIICFIDGSCIGNGSKHARAGLGVVFPDYPQHNVSERVKGMPQTNNRAEYSAYLRALELADLIDPQCIRMMTVNTDCKLLMDSVTKWLTGWKRKGWKKADGKPVLNRDLLEQIDELSQKRRVIWNHVLAHTGKTDYASVHNAQADELAKVGAKK